MFRFSGEFVESGVLSTVDIPCSKPKTTSVKRRETKGNMNSKSNYFVSKETATNLIIHTTCTRANNSQAERVKYLMNEN
jgi:hypothetical protein